VGGEDFWSEIDTNGSQVPECLGLRPLARSADLLAFTCFPPVHRVIDTFAGAGRNRGPEDRTQRASMATDGDLLTSRTRTASCQQIRNVTIPRKQQQSAQSGFRFAR
jgi:hypothetical protein